MLLNSFFHIAEKDFSGVEPVFSIRLNPMHEIYKAHFPGTPITPGVCQIQIVTELLSLYLGCGVRLSDVKNIKYMAVISPEETAELTVRFIKVATDGDVCKVSAIFTAEKIIFSKMSMTYHVVCNNPDIQ